MVKPYKVGPYDRYNWSYRAPTYNCWRGPPCTDGIEFGDSFSIIENWNFQVRLVTLFNRLTGHNTFSSTLGNIEPQLNCHGERKVPQQTALHQGYRRIRETALGQCCGTGGLRWGGFFWRVEPRIKHPPAKLKIHLLCKRKKIHLETIQTSMTLGSKFVHKIVARQDLDPINSCGLFSRYRSRLVLVAPSPNRI